jgi:hypothetical protein
MSFQNSSNKKINHKRRKTKKDVRIEMNERHKLITSERRTQTSSQKNQNLCQCETIEREDHLISHRHFCYQ